MIDTPNESGGQHLPVPQASEKATACAFQQTTCPRAARWRARARLETATHTDGINTCPACRHRVDPSLPVRRSHTSACPRRVPPVL